jgi:general secretion pathway protein G
MAMGSARNARAVADIHNIAQLCYVYAAGSNANFPNSLADIDSEKQLDPWGNPYQYLNLTNPGALANAREDRLGVAINTRFDLYSMGPDGMSAQKVTDPQSQDDIVYASDGSFINMALLY